MNASTRLAALVQRRFGPVNAYALAAIHANEPRCERLARAMDRGIALPGEVANETARIAVNTMAAWGVTR